MGFPLCHWTFCDSTIIYDHLSLSVSIYTSQKALYICVYILCIWRWLMDLVWVLCSVLHDEINVISIIVMNTILSINTWTADLDQSFRRNLPKAILWLHDTIIKEPNYLIAEFLLSLANALQSSYKVASWQSRQGFISHQLSIKDWTLAAVIWWSSPEWYRAW